MIETLVPIYLIFLGLIASLSAKNRVRFLIGVELQVLGAILLALVYGSPILGLIVLVAIALEALKLSAAVGLR